jgi:hypothetical protein
MVLAAKGLDGTIEYEGVPDVEGCTAAWLVSREDGEGIPDVISVV